MPNWSVTIPDGMFVTRPAAKQLKSNEPMKRPLNNYRAITSSGALMSSSQSSETEVSLQSPFNIKRRAEPDCLTHLAGIGGESQWDWVDRNGGEVSPSGNTWIPFFWLLFCAEAVLSPGNLGPSALDVLLLVEFKFWKLKKKKNPHTHFLNILLNAYWEFFLRGRGV